MPTSLSWEEFCDARIDYLTALAITVAQGVTRQDTTHPAFCGCIDWHSCVHGLYALLAVSHLTDDPQWSEMAESLFHPEGLDQELAAIQREELNDELPYGYAWFLKLAQERERVGSKQDLLPLATELARRLEQWMFSLTKDQVLGHIRNRAYGNLSWAILNLWEWAQFRNDARLIDRLTGFTRDHILPADQDDPLFSNEINDEFFSASLQRLRVLLMVLPKNENKKWLEVVFKEGDFLQPVEHPSSPHSAGLNFSRSWAFWDLYMHTGQTAFRDRYVNHIVTHMELPQYWRDNYKKYSHWVAQFGIYAIALSFDGHEFHGASS